MKCYRYFKGGKYCLIKVLVYLMFNQFKGIYDYYFCYFIGIIYLEYLLILINQLIILDEYNVSFLFDLKI